MVPKKFNPLPPKRFQKLDEKKGKKRSERGPKKVHKIVLQLFKVLKMVPMKVNSHKKVLKVLKMVPMKVHSHKKSTQRSARKVFQKSPKKKY